MKEYNAQDLENIARVLGDLYTGTQITNIFNEQKYIDSSGEPTKWRRIYYYLNNQYYANDINRFISYCLTPSAFHNSKDKYIEALNTINTTLVYRGYYIEDDGTIKKGKKANNISEAEKLTKELQDILQSRNIHPKLLQFCKEEYLQDSYFACVVEACKSIYSTIREKTGLSDDGQNLIEKAFSIKHPYLLLHYDILNNESLKNEHLGLQAMIIGIHKSLRSPMAHTARIEYIEINRETAIEVLTIISYIHKKLENILIIRKE